MISQRAQNIVASVTGELSAKVTELKAQGKDVIKLNIGEPDFRPPENIAEAAITAIEEGFSKYVAIPGARRSAPNWKRTTILFTLPMRSVSAQVQSRR